MTQVDNTTGSPNQHILDEADARDAWFHAKKTKAIWAKQVESQQVVETLEGTESVKPGDFLCRGVAGEVWPQAADRLRKNYSPTDKVDSEGWRQYEPRADAEGVMAARIDHPFKVTASWGELTGKPGDLLVKSYRDRDEAYPEDVWIVDQSLFAETYEEVSA